LAKATRSAKRAEERDFICVEHSPNLFPRLLSGAKLAALAALLLVVVAFLCRPTANPATV